MIAGKPNTPFSAICDRPLLRLSGDERVIVWTVVNVEHWSLARPMPRQVLPPPMHGAAKLDRANWSWHEYGLRVGYWRILELFSRLNIPVTLAVNGSACLEYPRVVEAAQQAGWEMMGHGFEQMPMQALDDEAEAIRRTLETIRATTGQTVRGWESPGLTGTAETLELLAQAGLDYVSDLVFDEQPCLVTTGNGDLIALPYSVEMNDVVLHAVQSQPSHEIWRRGRAQLRRLHKDGEHGVRVMTVTLHPYLAGVPHRFDYLERLYELLVRTKGVTFMTGSSLTDWYRQSTYSVTIATDGPSVAGKNGRVRLPVS